MPRAAPDCAAVRVLYPLLVERVPAEKQIGQAIDRGVQSFHARHRSRVLLLNIDG